MNKVVMLGILTKDVELRYTQDSKAIGRFALAIKRDTKNKDGNYESDFVNCIVFGKLAETIANYFKKGNRILIDGRLQTGMYEKDGKKVYTTDIVVDSFHFIDKKETQKEDTNNEEQYKLPF